MENTLSSNNKYVLSISLGLLVMSILVRLIYVNTVIIDTPIRADAQKYFNIAINVVEHGVYSHLPSKDPGQGPIANGMITPGYPLSLALTLSIFKNPQTFYKVVLNTQALLSALTALIAFLIATKVLPLWGATLVGLIMAFSPHQIVFSGYVLTETLFTLLLFGAIYGLITSLKKISPTQFFLIGILFGLAALVRPAILFFPLFISPFVWFYRPGKKMVSTLGALLLGLLIIWAPWGVWKSVYGHPETGPKIAAATFAYGSYPNLVYEDAKFYYPNERNRRGGSYKEDPDFVRMSSNLSTAVSVALKRAANDPTKYLKWYLFGKAAMFWAWDNNLSRQGGPFVYPIIKSVYDKMSWAKISFKMHRFIHPFLIGLSFISIFILAYKLIYQKEKSDKNFILLIIILLPVYYTIIHVVLLPLPRYAIPVHGFAYIVGLFGIIAILSNIYDRVLLTGRGQDFHKLFLAATKKVLEK